MLSRDSAGDAARDVAGRIAAERCLEAAIEASTRQSTAEYVRWRPHTVAGGYAGTAILFGAADARWPGEGWDRAGHRHLAAAVAATETQPHVNPSLYTGLAGIGFAAQVLAGGRDRYRRLLTAVDAELIGQVDEIVDRLEVTSGTSVGAFDAISGLSGIGAYLLTRRDEPAARAVLERLLSALGRLLRDEGVPRRWHTPHRFLSPSMQRMNPHGNLNCGLAHGVPGPIALLAIAQREGVTAPHATEGLRVATRWLVDQRTDGVDGPDWPTTVGLDRAGGAVPPPASTHRPSRATWCYGTPGVVRALWLAGTALDDPATCTLSVDTMRAVVARPAPERLITTPTFCHGTAGLLQIVTGFARDTGHPELVAAAAGLAAELAGQRDPAAALGYRDVEASGAAVDHPTLLDGAAGVALALLGATAPDRERDPGRPPWERLFLLG
ncbi:lanthionine synthetase C family protein [Pseudonocardia charpentierae]|uniref:Lanthionine synthetase C family protein n=1 Tax=Pseudonocardia charpentierae TaxID=3075545 RepID=A0ABU2NHU1_9PSEU|nr:lanthionine synthetase C family protein [Pseudonocardia sp. DSM 45834]MDT0353142.1 lanthionine synthetase C family protein [Pseudonocardia sp. DSM 45834]